jgi:hypothetical protein
MLNAAAVFMKQFWKPFSKKQKGFEKPLITRI